MRLYLDKRELELLADFTEEELEDFYNRPPPKPLAIYQPCAPATYKKWLRDQVARELRESLRRRQDDEECDDGLRAPSPPTKSHSSSTPRLGEEVDALGVGPSSASASAVEVSDLVRLVWLASIETEGTSSGPTSTENHVELCVAPLDTLISAPHPPAPARPPASASYPPASASHPPASASHPPAPAPHPPVPAPHPRSPVPQSPSPAPRSPSPALRSPSPAPRSRSPAPHSPSPVPHCPSPSPPSPSPSPNHRTIDPSLFLRRSTRIGTRTVAHMAAPPPVPYPFAAIANNRGKAKANGKAGSSKASTSASARLAKANGQKPRIGRQNTPRSDGENVPPPAKPSNRCPPKRRSPGSDDDDEEYVETPPAKRQKVEPMAGPAATNEGTTRQRKINDQVMASLVVGEVRGPCPWPGCDWELVGTQHGPLVKHFKTHVADKSVFSSTEAFRCPGCTKKLAGISFCSHVLGKHLGAKWRCLLHDYPNVKCGWTGVRADRVSDHMKRSHRDHLDVLDAARKP